MGGRTAPGSLFIHDLEQARGVLVRDGDLDSEAHGVDVNDLTKLRFGFDRLLQPALEEGKAPEASRRVPCRHDYGRDCAQHGLSRHGSDQYAAAPRIGPLAIIQHLDPCRPRCSSVISAVPFRDNQHCSSKQILT